MDGTDIIERFQLQVDDSSELSDDESLALANEVYREIQNDRDWSWLQATYTGTTSASVPYVALPSDFKKVLPNYGQAGQRVFSNAGVPVGYVDHYYPSNVGNMAVVFVGNQYEPYRVIPFSDRRNYRDASGYCYIDIPNSRLVFTKQPTTAEPIEFDYIKRATDITANTSPLFSEAYHEIISYGMAYKFNPIELTDKVQSYQRENENMYRMKLQAMQMEDAETKLSN